MNMGIKHTLTLKRGKVDLGNSHIIIALDTY
jgi:hypothetical protein